MRLSQAKLLTGALLSVAVVVGGGVAPVMANSPNQVAQRSSSVELVTIVGFVRNIVGDVVVIREASAPFRTFRISKRVQGIAGLVPGMKVKASFIKGTQWVESLVVLPDVKVISTSRVAYQSNLRVQASTVAPATIPPRPVVQPQITPPRPQTIPAPMTPPQPVRGLW